jgi:ATP-dependent helicase/nuclease subunit A
MKVVDLTPQQRDAVERLGQDVCVVAGPGSGKTGVLVERFAWLASARSIPPAEILTITYTEKAAREIKSRLAERFAASELKSEVQRAPVSTIHSFCARLLREYAVRANLDPKYEVLDERQARSLQHEAMTQVLDEFAAAKRDDFRFLASVWSSSDPAGDLFSLYEALRTNLWSGKIEIASPADVKPLLQRMLDEAHLALQAPVTTDAAQRRTDALRAFVAAGANPPDPIAWAFSLHVDLRGLHAGKTVYDSVMAIRRLQQQILDAYAAPARNMVRDLLVQFDKRYREHKRERAALDFSDLEEQSIRLLESDASVRRAVQGSFRYILMDELQDTNPAQWKLVKLIQTADNFFAVGDINQSIYGFRSADPGLFAKYEQNLKDAKKNIDRLQDNYRSRPPILTAASDFAKGAPGITPHELIAKGEFAKKEDACVEVIRVEGDSAAELESKWIAWRIRDLVARQDIRFEDIAILARTAAPFAELETALNKYSIPCVVVKRGKNFYKEPEIVDLTNWLRVLSDPDDKIAQFALLRSPFYGFGDEDLLRRKLSGQMVPAEVAMKWDALRSLREETPPDLILSRLVDDCGYETNLNSRARANVDKFLDLLRDWHKSEPGDYTSWIADLDNVRENEKEPNAPSAETGDAVQLMSIHAAKGLQFKVVFIAGLNRTSSNNKEQVCWSRETGLGLTWRNPISGGESVDDPATATFKTREKEREAHEADRLLYVAMTRAKEHLVLSWRESKRPFVWPAQVEERLGINWDAIPDMTPVVNDRGIRLYRATQAPPADLLATAAAMTPPPDLIPRLVAQHGPAPSYTITAVTDFAACPRHYWLARDLHWPLRELADEEEDSGANLGTQVHEILARGAAQEGDPPAALQLAERFWNSELGRRAAQATRVEREFPFDFEHKDAIFSGKIDLFFVENGESVLVDYKTGKVGHRLPAYELQLRLYSLGAPSTPKKAYLSLLTEDRVHEVDLSVGGERWIDEFLRAQEIYEFPLNEGAPCAQCEFWQRECPSGYKSGGATATF